MHRCFLSLLVVCLIFLAVGSCQVSIQSLGCFIDASVRDLTGYYVALRSNNTPSNCARICSLRGFRLAAVQYSYECFCGNTRARNYSQVPLGQCNMTCAGDRAQKCGAGWRNHIYRISSGSGTPYNPAEFPPLHVYRGGQPSNASSWLISDWNAGQSHLTRWWPDNVVRNTANNAIDFILNNAPAGTTPPYRGSEIQSKHSATLGTWRWVAKSPNMRDGAIWGLFTYKADWQNDPWIEFDFEWVGAGNNIVELNVHMENAAGQHITPTGGAKIINLGFDASLAYHLYEVTITGTSAIFRVDGQIVHTFTGADMPGGRWTTGPMKSFVDLWVGTPGMVGWTGTWNPNGPALRGSILGAGWIPLQTVVRAEEASSSRSGLSTGAIVGIAVAAVCVVVTIALVALVVIYRHRKDPNNSPSDSNSYDLMTEH